MREYDRFAKRPGPSVVAPPDVNLSSTGQERSPSNTRPGNEGGGANSTGNSPEFKASKPTGNAHTRRNAFSGRNQGDRHALAPGPSNRGTAPAKPAKTRNAKHRRIQRKKGSNTFHNSVHPKALSKQARRRPVGPENRIISFHRTPKVVKKGADPRVWGQDPIGCFRPDAQTRLRGTELAGPPESKSQSIEPRKTARTSMEPLTQGTQTALEPLLSL